MAPDTGDRQAALWAIPFLQTILEHFMPRALNEKRLARRAKRAGRLAENISFIDEVESRF